MTGNVTVPGWPWWMALAATCLACATPAQEGAALSVASPIDSVVGPVARSGFRLLGRVTQLGAVTTASIAPSNRTARVTVDSVWVAPRSVRPLAGRQVTLILRDTAGIVLHAPYLFLASGVQFDTGTVLREEGRFPAGTPDFTPGAQALLIRADSMISSRAIARRGSSAAAVVVGRIIAVAVLAPTNDLPRRGAADNPPDTGRPSPGRRPVARRREHHPDWQVATLRVGTQIRPASASLPATVRVLFASGRDALYAATPRLADGDSVILLLRAATELPAHLLPAGVDTAGLFLVLHPLDRQPPSRQALVTAALP